MPGRRRRCRPQADRRLPGLRALALVAAAAGAGAVPAAAQACGVAGGTHVALGGGVAGYPPGGRVSGPAWGVGVGMRATPAGLGRPVEGRLDYRRVELDGGPAPQLVRQQTAVPFSLPGGLTGCPTLHLGASFLNLDGDGFSVLAAGLGLRVTAGPVDVGAATAVPFAEVRGLGARTGGAVLGVPVGESGLAVGGEAGFLAHAGRVVVRGVASLDGFDEGLGFTPYPELAAELSIGFRF